MSFTPPVRIKRVAYIATPTLAVVMFLLAVWLFAGYPDGSQLGQLRLGLGLAVGFALLEAWFIVSYEIEGMLMHADWASGARTRPQPRWPTPGSRIGGTFIKLLICVFIIWLLEPAAYYLIVALGPASACAAAVISMVVMSAETESHVKAERN